MSKEQIIAKISKMPRIYTQISRVTDKKGRKWIVIKTITEQWYSKAYFEKVMNPQEEKPKKIDDW